MRSFQRGLLLLAGIALFACAGPSAVPVSTGPTPRAERPTYTLGQKWIRDDGAYELIRIENDRYIFAARPGWEVHLTKDLAVARLARGKVYSQFDPPPTLTWLLEVGKGGATSGFWKSDGNPMGVLATSTWKVEAYEDVRVPIGRFWAFRISLKVEGSGFARELRSWYAPEADQRGIERDGLAKYLIPSDADSDDLYSTALPMDELQTIFGRIEAERVVIFLDACYSGAAGGRTFASKRTRAVNVDDLFLERLTRSKGRAIIAGAIREATQDRHATAQDPSLG